MNMEIPVVILCGGRGTRFGEQTASRPKPMIEIGGRPILRHIIEYYRAHGFERFTLPVGYRGDDIKRYFLEARSAQGDVTIAFGWGGRQTDVVMDPFSVDPTPWEVHCVDTGEDTQTAGRLLRVLDVWPYRYDVPAMLTYGDGVSDVDLDALLGFHLAHGRMVTVTGVRPPPRFGELVLDGDRVSEFSEKPGDGRFINGGFFVFDPARLHAFLRELDADLAISLDDVPLEALPLRRLAEDGELMAFRHTGFWQCMDNARDLETLESIWSADRELSPWGVSSVRGRRNT